MLTYKSFLLIDYEMVAYITLSNNRKDVENKTVTKNILCNQ